MRDLCCERHDSVGLLCDKRRHACHLMAQRALGGICRIHCFREMGFSPPPDLKSLLILRTHEQMSERRGGIFTSLWNTTANRNVHLVDMGLSLFYPERSQLVGDQQRFNAGEFLQHPVLNQMFLGTRLSFLYSFAVFFPLLNGKMKMTVSFTVKIHWP